MNSLKNIFTDFSDDVLRKIFKTFDSDVDNAVNAIKRGDTVSDEIIQKIAKNLDFNAISKIIFDNKLLGPAFDSKIDESILFIKNNPDNYDSVIQQFDDTIDRLTYLRGSPPELIQSLKNELKNIIERLPTTIQICLFSATLTTEVVTLADILLKNPVKILIKKEKMQKKNRQAIVRCFMVYSLEAKVTKRNILFQIHLYANKKAAMR